MLQLGRAGNDVVDGVFELIDAGAEQIAGHVRETLHGCFGFVEYAHDYPAAELVAALRSPSSDSSHTYPATPPTAPTDRGSSPRQSVRVLRRGTCTAPRVCRDREEY